MDIKGKVVERYNFYRKESLNTPSKCQAVAIQFTDGSEVVIDPYDCNWVELRLIEPTLTSDVIAIRANTLGEGSVE